VIVLVASGKSFQTLQPLNPTLCSSPSMDAHTGCNVSTFREFPKDRNEQLRESLIVFSDGFGRLSTSA